ncbi:MAG: molecular chaperone [Zetaproteobacteria bacterium]|nr:MAG: molecular chaperone [Zetaproteobacteria bacterium]
MAAGKDTLTRFLLARVNVRGAIIQGAHVIAEAARVHGLHGAPLQLFGQALLGSILLLSLSKGGVRQVLQFDAEAEQPSPMRRMLAEARAGMVRGYIDWRAQCAPAPDEPSADVRLDQWMAMPVTVSTVRDLGFGQPYISTIRHASPYIADQLVHYLSQSAQLRADVVLHGRTALLIEAMPGCDDDQWFKAVAQLARIPGSRLAEAPAEALHDFSELGLKIVGFDAYRYHCPCSAEKLAPALEGMDEQTLQSLRDEAGFVALSCRYCNRSYRLKA